jgi:hypothetical protein
VQQRLVFVETLLQVLLGVCLLLSLSVSIFCKQQAWVVSTAQPPAWLLDFLFLVLVLFSSFFSRFPAFLRSLLFDHFPLLVIICSLLRHKLFLLARMVVKYEVL